MRGRLRAYEMFVLFFIHRTIEIIVAASAVSSAFESLFDIYAVARNYWSDKFYAVLQLRKENAESTAYNLVGFQTNLKFGEQKRVFSMIPALRNAEFLRYGVMHFVQIRAFGAHKFAYEMFVLFFIHRTIEIIVI